MSYAGDIGISCDKVYKNDEKISLKDVECFGYQADSNLHLEKGESEEFKIYKNFWKTQKYLMAPHLLF